MLVADGDREPAVVGPDHLDGVSGVAEDADRVALTSVGCLVLGPVSSFT